MIPRTNNISAIAATSNRTASQPPPLHQSSTPTSPFNQPVTPLKSTFRLRTRHASSRQVRRRSGVTVPRAEARRPAIPSKISETQRYPSCEFQGITTFRQGDNVKILELSQNNLKGRLDDPIVIDAFAQLGTSLEQLWISENAIEGNLPAVFANEEAFPKLSILDVGSNRLRGSLHPAFANRGTKFGYLDTSGNELTSYFRYNNNDGDGEGDGDETIVATPTKETSSPLPHVHVAPTLLTNHQCAHLIDLAIRHTKANGGWTLDRHKAYKTTDVDIAICGGQLLEACNDHLKTTRVLIPK